MSKYLLNSSPIDGRYREEATQLSQYFSEFALLRERVFVETEFLLFVCRLLHISINRADMHVLIQLRRAFTLEEAEKIKAKEAKSGHDIIAVEQFLGDKLSDSRLRELIHFGLTSEDINNIAYGRLLKRFFTTVYIPSLRLLINELKTLCKTHASVAMLSHTHGQPATPTTLGKEIAIYAWRLSNRLLKLEGVTFSGKLNGAVGNYNAMYAAAPEIDWQNMCRKFVAKMGLKPAVISTQILPHDDYSDLLYLVHSTNDIVESLDRDIWNYCALGYMSVEYLQDEVGSSTMPHKQNPRDFETSEGNLNVSSALLGMMQSKLLSSRMQRDLSDSTVKRNYGIALGHALIGYKKTISGLRKLRIHPDVMKNDLDGHSEIYAEALQTLLRYEGKGDSFRRIVANTRGIILTSGDILDLGRRMGLSDRGMEKLKLAISSRYVGIAPRLTQQVASLIEQNLQ